MITSLRSIPISVSPLNPDIYSESVIRSTISDCNSLVESASTKVTVLPFEIDSSVPVALRVNVCASVLSKRLATFTVAGRPSSIKTVIVESAFRTTESIFWLSIPASSTPIPLDISKESPLPLKLRFWNSLVGSASASLMREARSTEAELPSSMKTVATVPLSVTESIFWLSVLSNTLDRSTKADAPFSIFTVSVESALRTTEVIS